MHYKELADKVRYFKEDEKGRKASGGRLFCADRLLKQTDSKRGWIDALFFVKI
ncbi:MAG: hypothetical protein IJT32_00085 [Lachnospiraceae bacterium]|nr:hypothetical protein [Lachnospiraceae bacterium]